MYTVETYYIDSWENSEKGLLIAENEEWILVKHIPVDYVIDGYRLYRKNHILKREHTAKEEKIEKVLRLKNVAVTPPHNFQFKSIIDTLFWCENEFGLFEFQDDDDTELFYGTINKYNDEFFVIDMINSDGAVEEEYDYDFEMSEIRTITFLSDYFISIKLLWENALK